MQLSAVILAGGQSIRMGRDKAQVRFHGRTLIELALDKIQKLGIQETFISARPGQDYSSLNCSILLDRELGLGPISGIEQALRVASSRLVLVLPVDLPNMTVELLTKMIQLCEPFTGVVPKLRGNIEPLVAVYPTHCHEYAMRSARGDCSVRNFAAACMRERAVRTFRVTESAAPCFANCNTPQELEWLHRRNPLRSRPAPRLTNL